MRKEFMRRAGNLLDVESRPMQYAAMFRRWSFTVLLAAMPALADTITTISGTTYSDATVTKTTPAAISIAHSTGMAKIPFKDLPAATQKKYGYDPAKAAESETQEAQRQAEQKQRAETQRLQAEQENAARQQALTANARKEAIENARKEALEIEKFFANLPTYSYETSTLGAQAALTKGAREMSQADYSAGMDELKTDLRELGGKYANLANSGVGIKPIAEALGFDTDEKNPKRLLLEVQQEIVKMQAEREAKKKPLYQTTPLANP